MKPLSTFYDDEMLAAAETAIGYLLSARGRAELRKHRKESDRVVALMRQMHDIPLEELHRRYTVDGG